MLSQRAKAEQNVEEGGDPIRAPQLNGENRFGNAVVRALVEREDRHPGQIL